MDTADALRIPRAGWCPQGRRAEDGAIPARYPLAATPTAIALQRTLWNVRRSDATLVLCRKRPSGGTALTIGLTRRLRKPMFVTDPLDLKSLGPARKWLSRRRVQVLNVAGPRAGQDAAIYGLARRFLRYLLSDWPPPRGPKRRTRLVNGRNENQWSATLQNNTLKQQ